MTDRGVSVTVNYVIGLAIATLLITALVYATGGIVDDRREATVRSELAVVGERVSAGLESADRLAMTGADTVVVQVPSPDAVAGEAYTVELDASAEAVILQTHDPDVSVSVPFRNETDVETSEASGGSLEIALDGAGNLEVRDS